MFKTFVILQLVEQIRILGAYKTFIAIQYVD